MFLLYYIIRAYYNKFVISSIKGGKLMNSEDTSLFTQGLLDEVPSSITHDCIEHHDASTPPPAPATCCCDKVKDIKFDCCEISQNKDIDVSMHCLARMLTVNVNIKDICPNKKIIVAVLVFEDNKLKGIKAREVFTKGECGCKCVDVCAGEFCFVFKEDDLSRCRNFRVKVISHYTDL